MRRSSVRGGGPYRRPARARELGWDDSLYEDADRRLPRQRGYVRNDDQYYDPRYDDGDDDYDGHDDEYQAGRRHEERRRPRSRGRRLVRWFCAVMSLLILGTAAYGWWYYRELNNNLDKDPLNLGRNKLDEKQPNAQGQTPLDILLLGSDSRNSDENVELGGAKDSRGREPLADVQMLLHVSADRSNISVVSVPRDTRVTIPECTDPETGRIYPKTTTETINASLQHGGPGCTVATWEELTGVPIDHFMMIDFAGVVDMADAVGGVPVCVRDNVYDPQSHLRLEQGTSIVQGEQALQWLRTRHGFEDGSDIGRTHAQHQYMNAMVRRLKAGTKLTDPGRLRELASAATNALTVDEGLGSVKKLYDLGNVLKEVPTERITMTTMPWVPDPGNAAHVVPNEEDAAPMWAMLRNDVAFDGRDKHKRQEPEPDATADAAPKAEIPVVVQNGTGTTTLAPVTGRAGEVAEMLTTLGFTRATTDATPKSQADTTLAYADKDQRADALTLAESIGLPERAVTQSSGVTEVTLVIGADWREGDTYPKDAGHGGAEPDRAPDSANPLAGDDEDACMEVNTAGGYTW